jgi:hypothetical protein
LLKKERMKKMKVMGKVGRRSEGSTATNAGGTSPLNSMTRTISYLKTTKSL